VQDFIEREGEDGRSDSSEICDCSFYIRETPAIRTFDPNHILFLEPAEMNTFNTSFDSRIVWAPHFYSWSFAPKY
jgi:hypothetical protein